MSFSFRDSRACYIFRFSNSFSVTVKKKQPLLHLVNIPQNYNIITSFNLLPSETKN